MQRAIERWIAATEQLEPDRGPADEALDRLIEAGWEEISRSSEVAEAASGVLSPDAMRRSHETGQELVRRLAERGQREGAFRTDVPTQWLVSAFFALIHAAHDAVRAGMLDSDSALKALSATVPDVFRGSYAAPAGAALKRAR